MFQRGTSATTLATSDNLNKGCQLEEAAPPDHKEKVVEWDFCASPFQIDSKPEASDHETGEEPSIETSPTTSNTTDTSNIGLEDRTNNTLTAADMDKGKPKESPAHQQSSSKLRTEVEGNPELQISASAIDFHDHPFPEDGQKVKWIAYPAAISRTIETAFQRRRKNSADTESMTFFMASA